MADKVLNSWEPEDGTSFDLAELIDVLTMALNESRDEGEAFPYLCQMPSGQMVSRVTLAKTMLTDGSGNVEVQLTFAA